VIGCFGLAILNRRTERVLWCGEGARKRVSLFDLSFVLCGNSSDLPTEDLPILVNLQW
jgi:hypothetical protein